LDDSQQPVSTPSPVAVLSSSQLNALAVSVFLALNLGVPSIPLGAAMLDDPLQSLDDVNLLGLIDLLRRTKDRRQLIVSTHDRRFGRLLERKLRPVSEDQRTLVIELSGWGRRGPAVTQSEGTREADAIRIAA
jgi:energy-coupling factor transporter ATP-binding protein EcfA2